jgi:hypothetical protein
LSGKSINNAVVVSDLHCGCRYALYPCDQWETLQLQAGAVYKPSLFQFELWDIWKEFWEKAVPEFTHREDYVLVINGDGVDGRHHNSTTQISQNLADQFKIARAVLSPIIKLKHCRGLYWIGGTEAHVGQSSENEETLAQSLGAIPDSMGQYVRQTMWLKIGGEKGCLVHLAHHIGTTGSTHYETSAVMKELAEQFSLAGRWNNRPADIVVRSHRHTCCEVRVPTARGYGISVVTPGFQGKTPFSTKIPGGRQSEPQIGGLVIRQGDFDHYTRLFVKCMPREQEVVI